MPVLYTPQEVLDCNCDAFSVIGGILTAWGAIEKQIVMSVQQLEMALATASDEWPPFYTEMASMRSFKERKGKLRLFVEAHGRKADLSELDKVLQAVGRVDEIRHSLAHDLVTVMMPRPDGDREIRVLKLGDLTQQATAGKKPTEVVSFTRSQLEQVFATMFLIQTRILGVSGGIVVRLMALRRGHPE